MNKHKEIEKSQQKSLADMKRRTDVMSYALLAEVSHFHAQRGEDFKTAMKGFISEQINLYQNVKQLYYLKLLFLTTFLLF